MITTFTTIATTSTNTNQNLNYDMTYSLFYQCFILDKLHHSFLYINKLWWSFDTLKAPTLPIQALTH